MSTAFLLLCGFFAGFVATCVAAVLFSRARAADSRAQAMRLEAETMAYRRKIVSNGKVLCSWPKCGAAKEGTDA